MDPITALLLAQGGGALLKHLIGSQASEGARSSALAGIGRAGEIIGGGRDEAMGYLAPYLGAGQADFGAFREAAYGGHWDQPFQGTFQPQSFNPQGFDMDWDPGSSTFQGSYQPWQAPQVQPLGVPQIPGMGPMPDPVSAPQKPGTGPGTVDRNSIVMQAIQKAMEKASAINPMGMPGQGVSPATNSMQPPVPGLGQTGPMGAPEVWQGPGGQGPTVPTPIPGGPSPMPPTRYPGERPRPTLAPMLGQQPTTRPDFQRRM